MIEFISKTTYVYHFVDFFFFCGRNLSMDIIGMSYLDFLFLGELW